MCFLTSVRAGRVQGCSCRPPLLTSPACASTTCLPDLNRLRHNRSRLPAETTKSQANALRRRVDFVIPIGSDPSAGEAGAFEAAEAEAGEEVGGLIGGCGLAHVGEALTRWLGDRPAAAALMRICSAYTVHIHCLRTSALTVWRGFRSSRCCRCCLCRQPPRVPSALISCWMPCCQRAKTLQRCTSRRRLPWSSTLASRCGWGRGGWMGQCLEGR